MSPIDVHAPPRRSVALVLAAALLCAGLVATPTPALAADDAREAVVLSKQALQLYLEKKYVVAAELYRKASRLDPKQAAYAYAAGRAYHKAGRYAEAVLLYEEALKVDGPKGAYGLKAKHHLANARQRKGADAAWLAARSPAQTGKPKGAGGPEKPGGKTGGKTGGTTGKPGGKTGPAGGGVRKPAAPSRALGWSLLVGGGASLAAGVVFGLMGVSEQGKLRSDLEATQGYSVDGGTRELIPMDASEAASREAAANRKVVLGWSLGAVGVAAAAAGVWRVMRPADKVSLAPMPSATGVVARWAF